jgi:hypothetical protein
MRMAPSGSGASSTSNGRICAGPCRRRLCSRQSRSRTSHHRAQTSASSSSRRRSFRTLDPLPLGLSVSRSISWLYQNSLLQVASSQVSNAVDEGLRATMRLENTHFALVRGLSQGGVSMRVTHLRMMKDRLYGRTARTRKVQRQLPSPLASAVSKPSSPARFLKVNRTDFDFQRLPDWWTASYQRGSAVLTAGTLVLDSYGKSREASLQTQ